MKKLLIIKTGTTFDTISQKYGDFEDCVIKNAGVDKRDVLVWPAYKDKFAPALVDVSAIIITGSHSMVTDYDNWSTALAGWLRETAYKSIPMLGICYGHQLLAHAFGGVVDYHPKGKEFGTVKIELTEDGKRDPLLGVLPEEFSGHVAHSQTVLKVPINTRVLAKNNFEPHHAFVLNDNIWGVQFHPEFNAGVAYSYIEEFENSLIKGGYDVEALKKPVQENDYGKILLHRFIEIAAK